ncbi:hypothetical protein O6H91_02G093800 [Diphasiastrum complanatum]|uniref:Uncharacterized protein n=1 Tax=Diphasiastrum complanatum TaxID=34168 RepID=A0ACC2EIK2_DIPCM|nr:hypothetical protein O6H91_02G093800 [Diphasiastrum complanatum]
MTVWRYLLERLNLLVIEKHWKKDIGSKILRPGSLEGALLSREHSSLFAPEEEPAYAAAEQMTDEDISTNNLILKLEAVTCASQIKDATIAYLEKKLQANLEEVFSECQKMKVMAQQNFQLQKQLGASHARQRNLEKQIEHMSRTQAVLEEAEERLCTQLAESEAEWLEEFHSIKNELVSIHDVLRQKEAQIEHMSKTQAILEDAEERLCTQLAESEAEWLEEFHNFKNELASIRDVLRQKEAKISFLTSEINGNFRDVTNTSNKIENNLALQVAQSTQELQVLQSKYSEALASLEVARSEITEGRRSMDALKREMQRLESSKQMQIHLLEQAQKERGALQAQMHPIRLEAGGMMFEVRTPRALFVGHFLHGVPVEASGMKTILQDKS